MHCDQCLPHGINKKIVFHLRMALVLHEARALERKVEKGLLAPERIRISAVDGHFILQPNDPISDDAFSWHVRREQAKRLLNTK